MKIKQSVCMLCSSGKLFKNLANSRQFYRCTTLAKDCVNMGSSSVLVQKVNPTTGKFEWELQREDYDYHQEVARAAFADMLHDWERNKLYHVALKKAITKMQSAGKKAHVLDIGTGTGLLSMMAARAGADSVTACETFQPMAKCALQVIADNGLADKIKLIPKRSTDIKVGPTGDMPHRANILVTEVFDTELIGEGAIGTFNHAHAQLLDEDCIVVPARATVFAQLIECDLALRWHRLLPVSLPNLPEIHPYSSIANCPGSISLHDVQLAQLDPSLFKPITPPIPVLHFDWNSSKPIKEDESSLVTFQPSASGTAHAVCMWWSLDMDVEGEVELSCAPPWAHPEGKQGKPIPWRDHWMQALYYLPRDIEVQPEQSYVLDSRHDEYSLWFDVYPASEKRQEKSIEASRPFCHCGLHSALSYTRLGQLNDLTRWQTYTDALKLLIKPGDRVLCLGDASPIALLCPALGASSVLAAETNPAYRAVLKNWVEANNLQQSIIVTDSTLENKTSEDLGGAFDVVIGEPWFGTSLLPWHHLYWWYWRSRLTHLLAPGTKILPQKAIIKAIPVQFEDLWKIRAPVVETEGFQLHSFDKLIKDAIAISDEVVEPQPLWEYPSVALGHTTTLMTLDLSQSPHSSSRTEKGQIRVETKLNPRVLHGVCLWMDWDLGNDKEVTCGGPVVTPTLDQNVVWDKHTRQGVYFFSDLRSLSADDNLTLDYQVTFVAESGELQFRFAPLQ